MKSWLATYHSPQLAEPAPATVLFFTRNINVGYRSADGRTVTLDWPLYAIDSKYDMAAAATVIRNTKEQFVQVLIEGKQAHEALQEMKAEQQKPWHKREGGREWIRNSVLFAGIIGLLVLLYFLIVPWLSEKMASRISVKTEKSFGDAVFDGMQLTAMEDTAASFLLNDFFDAMDVQTAYSIRITAVKGETVNAFALPGGRIVVYTALLKQLQTYPELAALLSHEFTHVNNKHSTKSIFRRLGSKIFLGLLFGNFGNVTSVLIDQADNLKSLKHSRKLETEADMQVLNLLQARKIDPSGFIKLFEHLREAAPSSALPEFLGSHPDIDKRIANIKEAASNAVVHEHEALQSIFDKLKQTTKQ